jgi:hypothetical protein
VLFLLLGSQMSAFVAAACNERGKDTRIPGSFMQCKVGGPIHVMHYADRTLCGRLEQWMGGYRTFDEDKVIFSLDQLPRQGTPCKTCFSSLAAEARRIYQHE